MADEKQDVSTTESIPLPGTSWRHSKGNIYRVLVVANLTWTREDFLPTVVYEGPDGNVWARKLSDWHRSMKAVQ